MSRVIEALPPPSIYYHPTDTTYWRRDKNGRWFKVNESGAKVFLADRGYLKTPEASGANSEVERCLMEIQESQNVSYVGSLAGHGQGVYEMGGNQILVVDSPKFIESAPGNWDTLEALFEGLLVDGNIDQRPHFFGWAKNAMESFRSGVWKASQLLTLAGPVGCGKSLTQNLITKMFGGRSAKPYQFMTGCTDFNSHMFGAEHQVLEDESENVDINSRRHFAAYIKTILTGRDQNCHGKNKTALVLQPVWRMSLSLNDDPERLQVLPPLDSDVRDKIMILKTCKAPMPMPTGTPEEDKAFWNQLVSELPAFLHYLEEWEVPEHLSDCRYGIQAFHHPEIVVKLQQATPEIRMMELIDHELFRGEPVGDWEGTAAKLKASLTSTSADLSYEARKLLAYGNACGTYLGRLEFSDIDHIKGRISRRLVNGNTVWKIKPKKRQPRAPQLVSRSSREAEEVPNLPPPPIMPEIPDSAR